MKKKLRLRKEVKEFLAGLLVIIIIIGTILIEGAIADRDVQTCIENGVEPNICEELRK